MMIKLWNLCLRKLHDFVVKLGLRHCIDQHGVMRSRFHGIQIPNFLATIGYK